MVINHFLNNGRTPTFAT